MNRSWEQVALTGLAAWTERPLWARAFEAGCFAIEGPSDTLIETAVRAVGWKSRRKIRTEKNELAASAPLPCPPRTAFAKSAAAESPGPSRVSSIPRENDLLSSSVLAEAAGPTDESFDRRLFTKQPANKGATSIRWWFLSTRQRLRLVCVRIGGGNGKRRWPPRRLPRLCCSSLLTLVLEGCLTRQSLLCATRNWCS